MALVNVEVRKINDNFSVLSRKFRWADELDIPSDEILLRVKYERDL